ncbi:MAG TPA: type II toxin-antitoxin system PrlF family antitoxin [Thermoanaerobaculia bacterium]|nr:type II toxin-antitoxin system PrlF family antitoxin [Thermoanaerobaculia bacterium]
MTTATITSKGQITLPKTVREHLRLGEGDRVDFVIEEGGAVRVVALKRSVRELAGFVPYRGERPLTIEELDEALSEALAEDDARIRRGE